MKPLSHVSCCIPSYGGNRKEAGDGMGSVMETPHSCVVSVEGRIGKRTCWPCWCSDE